MKSHHGHMSGIVEDVEKGRKDKFTSFSEVGKDEGISWEEKGTDKKEGTMKSGSSGFSVGRVCGIDTLLNLTRGGSSCAIPNSTGTCWGSWSHGPWTVWP